MPSARAHRRLMRIVSTVLAIGLLAAGPASGQLSPNPNYGVVVVDSDTTQTSRFDNFRAFMVRGSATFTNAGPFNNGFPGSVPQGSADSFENLVGHVVNTGVFSNWGVVATGSTINNTTEDGVAAPVELRGSFMNTGTVFNGGFFYNGGLVRNIGTFDNVGVYRPTTGMFNNLGTLQTSGFFGTDEASLGSGLYPTFLSNTGVVVNTGVMQATVDNSGTFEVGTGGVFKGIAIQLVMADGGPMLSAGTWKVVAGAGTASMFLHASADAIGSAAPLSTIGAQASVLLSGVGSRFENLNTLMRNEGWLGIRDGRSFRIAAPESKRLHNTGTVSIGSGSTFVVDPDRQLFNSGGGRVENDGTLMVRPLFADPAYAVQLQNDATLINRGWLTNAATFANGGGARSAAGTLVNQGTVQNAAGAALLSGEVSTITNDGTFINEGTVVTYSMRGTGTYIQRDGSTQFLRWTAGEGWGQSRTIVLGGAFQAEGTLTGELVNDGLVKGLGLRLAGPVTGSGRFEGEVEFLGGFSPGHSPALVTTGNIGFGITNVLTMELGGLTRGAQYDSIDAVHANLGGTLRVSFIDLGEGGFAAAAGNSFDLLRAGSLNGDFARFELAPLANGLAWQHGEVTLADGSVVYRLAVTAVPEVDARWLLMAGLGLGGCIVRRRVRCDEQGTRRPMCPARFAGARQASKAAVAVTPADQ